MNLRWKRVPFFVFTSKVHDGWLFDTWRKKTKTKQNLKTLEGDKEGGELGTICSSFKVGIGVSIKMDLSASILTTNPTCAHTVRLTRSYVLNQPSISVRNPKWRLKTRKCSGGRISQISPSSSSPFLFPPSFTCDTPNPHSDFLPQRQTRFISLVKILACQSDQLPVSRALHGSSNYNPVQLARAHVAVGQPL